MRKFQRFEDFDYAGDAAFGNQLQHCPDEAQSNGWRQEHHRHSRHRLVRFAPGEQNLTEPVGYIVKSNRTEPCKRSRRQGGKDERPAASKSIRVPKLLAQGSQATALKRVDQLQEWVVVVLSRRGLLEERAGKQLRIPGV